MMSGKINAKGDSRPEQKDLNEHVVPYLGKKWEDLAFRLLPDKDTNHISQITEENRTKGVTECAKEMLKLWLSKDYPDITWNKLIKELRERPVELAYLAKQIQDKKLPGDSRPEQKDLNEHVVPYLGKKWEDLAFRLLPDKDTNHISQISEENRTRGVTECAKEMLKLWLSKDYPDTTWNKLIRELRERPVELAYLAKQIENKLLPEQSEEGIQIEAEGYPSNSKAKEGERKHEVNEDGAKPKSSVIPDESTTGSGSYPPAIINEDFHMKEYPKISKDKPAFAVIFDNEKVHGNDDRTGTKEDESSICSLMENFKGTIVVHEHVVKDLTKNQTIGAFKMLGKPDPTTLSDEEMVGAIKLFYPPSQHGALFQLPTGTKRSILINHKVDFSKYNCFMAFIMSHGNKRGIAGTDGEFFKVDTLSSYIAPCEELKDKPKMFFLQYCRGSDLDIVMDDFQAPEDDKTPSTADFLYVYATPENYKAARSITQGSLFIQTLVEVMKKTLYHYHFEEILFVVKNVMGRKTMEYKRKGGTGQRELVHIKQILSVVSQMRGRVFFVED